MPRHPHLEPEADVAFVEVIVRRVARLPLTESERISVTKMQGQLDEVRRRALRLEARVSPRLERR
jgi:hypothetical protein